VALLCSSKVLGAALSGVMALGSTVALADGYVRRSLKDVGPPRFSWTGSYVGMNAGYSWGDADYSLDNAPGPGAGVFAVPANRAAVNAAGTGSVSGDGFTGGIQGGYNYQMGTLVFGGEIDFQRFDIGGDRSTGFVSTIGPGATTTSLNSDWLMTARLRLGVAFDRTLLYATGGYALTDANVRQSQSWNLTGAAITVNGSYGDTSKSSGYVIGGGLEHALTDNWTFRGEYLYLNFGSQSSTGVIVSSPPTFRQTMSLNADIDASIVRTAINYKF
jgi:outer membrane immunogenic protein